MSGDLPEAVRILADESPAEASERATLDLRRGMHMLTLPIDPGRRPNGVLHWEMVEVPGGGQARFE